MQFVSPWSAPRPVAYHTNPDIEYLFNSYNHARNELSEIPAALREPTARAILICKVLVPRGQETAYRASACPPFRVNNIQTSLAGHCCPHLFVHISDA
jgi:hypothetical protein